MRQKDASGKGWPDSWLRRRELTSNLRRHRAPERIRPPSLGKKCGNLTVDGEEAVIPASHFLCGLKRVQKMIGNCLGSRQRRYRRIFHKPVLKRIPRVRPLVRFAHEVIADALSIFVIEGGQRREKFMALRFVAR